MEQAISRWKFSHGRRVQRTCRRGKTGLEGLEEENEKEEEEEEVQGLTSHSRRMSSKENSLLNQMSSQRKQKHREPLSWESAGDTPAVVSP